MTLAKSAAVRFGSMRAKPPLAFAGQRIGLLGGSFNPPHAAHLMISVSALRRLGLSAVWWLVTPGNPLKPHGDLAPLGLRLELCRRLARHPRIKITGFEEALPTAYTAATLDFLQQRYPGVRFVWLMGADNFAAFHHWQDWRHIAHSMPMAVFDRPRYRLAALAGRAARTLHRSRWPEAWAPGLAGARAPAWIFLTGRLSALTSTQIRTDLAGSLPTCNI